MEASMMHMQIQRALITEKYELAASLVKSLLKLYPNDAYGWTSLAKLQLNDRKYVAAKQSVARALQINSSFAWAHCVNGLLEGKQGNYSDARDAFEIALKIDPEDLDVLYDYASYLAERRVDLDKAERLTFRRMILLPDNAVNYELQGRVMMAGNEVKDAEQAFKTAIQLDASLEKAYLGLAKIEMFHRKNSYAAVDWLRPALLLNPDSLYLRQYFNQALQSKNGMYGVLWGTGLLYASGVRWNLILFVSFFVMLPVYFYFSNVYPFYLTFINTLFLVYVIYIIYSWASRPLMKLLLERKWLN